MSRNSCNSIGQTNGKLPHKSYNAMFDQAKVFSRMHTLLINLKSLKSIATSHSPFPQKMRPDTQHTLTRVWAGAVMLRNDFRIVGQLHYRPFYQPMAVPMGGQMDWWMDAHTH